MEEATSARNEARPWCPQLQCKPHAHATQPLKSVYTPTEHPYEVEIKGTDPLAWEPPPAPQMDPAVQAAVQEIVETPEAVHEMVEWLEEQSEVAIDCEFDASSMLTTGSYLGRVCLIQIATRARVYLVDTLKPRMSGALEQLNRVTANPKILKASCSGCYRR